MLDRVVMDVIDMPGLIGLITNLMLPETPLPQGDLGADGTMPIDSRAGGAGPLGRPGA